MKKILLITFLIFSTNSFSAEADPFDEFGGANPGASVDNPSEQYKKDVENFACDGNLCKIFSVTVKGEKLTVSTFYGDPANGSSGSSGSTYNAYYGNGGLGGNQLKGYGVGVTWEKSKCNKEMNVDRSVYKAITTYMDALVNSDGSTNPAFTPAEETIILFYTTIMQLVKGATCN